MLPERLEHHELSVRRSTPDDLAGLLDAIAVSLVELGRWLPFARRMPTADDEAAFLANATIAFDEDTDWLYTIHEKPSDIVTGAIALHRRSDPSSAEIGYWIRTDRTGRGYATAATRLLMNAAFVHLPDLRRVEIRMDEANGASVAVPRKLSFALDRHEDRPIETSGHTGRGLVWALTREQWSH